MLSVISSREAAEIISDHFPGGNQSLRAVEVSLQEAVGYRAYEDITAGEYVPDFTRSAVDGWAVKASDTFGCSENTPALLKVAGEVVMGIEPDRAVNAGECLYVPTGGGLPKGADAVVMLEYADVYGDSAIGVFKPCAPGANVIYRGDDVKPGDIVIKAGKRITVRDTGSLAALGIAAVKAFKPPVVAVISTGDEVVDITEPLSGAKVRDINSYVLSAGLKELGCEPVRYGIIRDDYDELLSAVRKAVESSDMVLISGGSSVGTKDLTLRVMEAMGKVLFHGISIKPGKPTILGDLGGVPVFGLPGHPAAVFFIFNLFVKPLLLNMMGDIVREISVTLPLARAIPSNHGREECVPVFIKDGRAVPISGKSGLITILSRAEGYIRIDRDTEGISAGEPVRVIMFEQF